MVIILDKLLENSQNEIKDKNYEKALKMLNGFKGSDEDTVVCNLLKMECFMGLHEYESALEIINPMIADDPYNDALWFLKVQCHYFSGDGKAAKKALAELERIADTSDVDVLLQLARICNLIHEGKKAVKYSDIALEIDPECRNALFEKALGASEMKDTNLMKECAEVLMENWEGDLLGVVFPMSLMLFSHHYRECYEIISKIGDEHEEQREMMTAGLFSRMCDEMGVVVGIEGTVDDNTEEVLNLLFDYHENGVTSREISGVKYIVVNKEE